MTNKKDERSVEEKRAAQIKHEENKAAVINELKSELKSPEARKARYHAKESARDLDTKINENQKKWLKDLDKEINEATAKLNAKLTEAYNQLPQKERFPEDKLHVSNATRNDNRSTVHNARDVRTWGQGFIDSASNVKLNIETKLHSKESISPAKKGYFERALAWIKSYIVYIGQLITKASKAMFSKATPVVETPKTPVAETPIAETPKRVEITADSFMQKPKSVQPSSSEYNQKVADSYVNTTLKDRFPPSAQSTTPPVEKPKTVPVTSDHDKKVAESYATKPLRDRFSTPTQTTKPVDTVQQPNKETKDRYGKVMEQVKAKQAPVMAKKEPVIAKQEPVKTKPSPAFNSKIAAMSFFGKADKKKSAVAKPSVKPTTPRN